MYVNHAELFESKPHSNEKAPSVPTFAGFCGICQSNGQRTEKEEKQWLLCFQGLFRKPLLP
jgi:hypothetical protein